MMIYPDGATLHADYSDGDHVIHYVSAVVMPGRSVVFTTAPGAGPAFRLTYERKGPDSLDISFAMAPPGQAAFNPIATGTVHKTR